MHSPGVAGLRCSSQWWQDNSGRPGSRGIYQELICQPFAATIELPYRPAGRAEAELGLQYFPASLNRSLDKGGKKQLNNSRLSSDCCYNYN